MIVSDYRILQVIYLTLILQHMNNYSYVYPDHGNSNCDFDFVLFLATGNNIFCQKMSVSVDGNFLYSVIGLYIIVAKVRKL